jgi:YidC/Oxa1 family membrane protein insertase
MDNRRLFIWMTLLVMIWLTYRQWIEDYPPVPVTPTTPTAGVNSDEPVLPTLPDVPVPGDADTLPEISAPGQAVADPGDGTSAQPAQTIRVRTDVLDVLIDTRGGDLVRADTPLYPIDKNNPDVPVRLLDYEPESRWVFQTGYRGTQPGDEPNHLATFSSALSAYTLAEGEDELLVELQWDSPGPLQASKTYRFSRGSYAIGLTLTVENPSAQPWSGVPYLQLVRHHVPAERSYMSVDSYSFRGPVLYDGDSYDKLDVDDLAAEPITQIVTSGWLAGIEHHFVAAAVPPPEESVSYQAGVRGTQYVLTALSPVRELAPGGRSDYPAQLFVGPKLQEQLAATGDRLDLTVDYGVLTVLAKPLFLLLDWVHGFVGNWGWSIVLVTLLIKLAFYKLTAASGRSMAKMRKVQPRLKALQERYKDDRQALSQAMMKIYKEEKINPAAGCLPILIQMPFFFAFYWVLIESVEIRQAPFALWITDLSVRDPFFVLPLLMGAAMFMQTRLNPAPPDPIQARVMQIMPIAFTAMFAFFPAGLVLYWLTNTGLSILQQWRINKLVAA